VRPRAVAVVSITLTAILLAVVPDAPAQERPPGPPPMAFRSATLQRPRHAIEVRMSAMAEIGVRVTITRHGRRVGRRVAAVHIGRTLVRVNVARRLLRRLRTGQHVDLMIEFGTPVPVRIFGAVLHRARRPSSLLVA
jgi:hypothetical protein